MYGVTVRTLFARGRYMADGMGKMRGGKRRQHPALPSQLKEADRYKQTCFSDLGCRCQQPVNSGMLLRGWLSHADMTAGHSRAL